LIEKIEVINLFGQILFQIKPEKELYIGQTIENPGMYFINFIYKDNQNQIIKIIRE
jgi:hypothetical protein